MMQAIIAPRVLTPGGWRKNCAVLIEHGRIANVVDADEVPVGYAVERCTTGTLIPGFLDLQVNGGGRVLFNDQPSVDGIVAIAAAHRRLGTTSMLPTLISDDLSVVEQGIAAVEEAIERRIPGILGIHIEGPFLNAARKGIHDARKFAALDEAAINLLASLRGGKTLVTLAPECTTPALIAELRRRGVIVSAGHSTASYEVMTQAADAGLTGVTHLFNAMPPLSGRDPGVIGAALTDNRIYAGIIADGHHVAAANLTLALRMMGADRLCLVSDAMPSVGADLDGFKLGDVCLEQLVHIKQ
jgi:N-acetylglucosamine-6-phosphate deacetylase